MVVTSNLIWMLLLSWTVLLPFISLLPYNHTERKLQITSHCDQYNLPVNAMWTTGTNHSNIKQFKCQDGYQLQVDTICKNKKDAWILEPYCQVECPSGENVTNSDTVTQTRTFREQFIYDCLAGYTRYGSTGTLNCSEDGSWSEEKLCEAVVCLSGENITNAFNVTQLITFGEELSYNCLAGYTRYGDTGVLACDRNGNLSVEKVCGAVVCPSDENITNSDDVTQSRTFGEEFSFECLDNYTMNGDTGTLTCGENSNWLDTIPCEAVQCPPGENITNSYNVTESRIFGEYFDYTCLDGYTRYGDGGFLICGTDGNWTVDKPCIAVECPSDENITNSDDVTQSRTFGEEFSFECLDNYTMNGDTGTLTCGKNSNWLETTTCEAVQCPPGENITNSYNVTESRIFGEYFDYTCLDGYTRYGDGGFLICGTDGNWTVDKPCIDCYSFTQNKSIYSFVLDVLENTTDTECGRICDGNDTCSTYSISPIGECILVEEPTIFQSYMLNVTQCLDVCKEMEGCVSMSYDAPLSLCDIFNSTFFESEFENSTGSTIFENLCVTVDTEYLELY